MEVNLPIFFISCSIPFALIGIIIILYFRFGWPGFIIFAIIIAFLPIQILVGKLNGTLLESVNVDKDLRIKVCAEVIEGIKFIKIYGWEIAFKHIIQTIRK